MDKDGDRQPRRAIRCPHCGWEYLPGEVLYPDNVVGRPNRVVRDGLGRIIYEDYADGDEPKAEELYVCDNCGKPFVVSVELTVKAKPREEELDFSEESVELF